MHLSIECQVQRGVFLTDAGRWGGRTWILNLRLKGNCESHGFGVYMYSISSEKQKGMHSKICFPKPGTKKARVKKMTPYNCLNK